MNFVQVSEEKFRLTMSPSATRNYLCDYSGVIAYKEFGVLIGIENTTTNNFYIPTSIFRK